MNEETDGQTMEFVLTLEVTLKIKIPIERPTLRLTYEDMVKYLREGQLQHIRITDIS